MNKKVYIGLSLDVIHHGHINLINNAKKYGYLIVGLLTDTAIATNKKVPLLNYNQRKKILSSLSGVDKIVPQNDWCYSSNILKYKPDIMVHGDDWNKDLGGKILKKNCLIALKKIGSKLIEIPHTKNIFSSSLQKAYFEQSQLLSRNGKYLERLIKSKDITRILEAHSPLSALIAENIFYKNKNGQKTEFDGLWSSSLTDSTLKGKPDIEVLDLNQRLLNISDIFNVTTKPLIMDIDTGGKLEHFSINCKIIETVLAKEYVIYFRVRTFQSLSQNLQRPTAASLENDQLQCLLSHQAQRPYGSVEPNSHFHQHSRNKGVRATRH